MEREFYSNGKLLITGEYAVLDGAKSLAIPTKYGQSLIVIETESKEIAWTSFDDKGRVWFEAIYDLESMTEISSSNSEISKTLHKTLIEAQKLNPHYLTDGLGYAIESKLTFPKDWGLGSSSTLINNIAQWANINPYQLLENTFGGSGYDIACAQHKKPILFELNDGLPTALELNYKPTLIKSLFFVYLNKKQNSRDAIKKYNRKEIDRKELSKTISQITRRMITSTAIDDFEWLMSWHENVISDALKTPTIKSKLCACA